MAGGPAASAGPPAPCAQALSSVCSGILASAAVLIGLERRLLSPLPAFVLANRRVSGLTWMYNGTGGSLLIVVLYHHRQSALTVFLEP